MVTVVISGYFDPLHIGHLEYIREASKLGDKLIVIVNNDNQSILKKGKFLMPDRERVKVVESIKGVDLALLSIDKDRSVCQTLALLNPDIFANGGDWKDNCLEEKICKRLGIKLVYGLGEKIQSSSNLIKKYIG